jgi:hypothetical protein
MREDVFGPERFTTGEADRFVDEAQLVVPAGAGRD